MSHILVENLKKTFKVPQAQANKGALAGLKELFYRQWKEIEVLDGLSFEIERGEFLGYIGANGAGKSTTLKCLTGILCPSSGKVSCAGFDPYRQRYPYTYKIGVVFGQKSILEYEVPVKASFALYREIYEMDKKAYESRIDFFNQILKIDEYWDMPVRKLSFGQRMRCEVAASLLHQPEIVFLDEPTIGLDASAKNEIRNFLRVVNEEEKTTVILTTHDMKDIEFLCERVIMIDQGRKVYDGALEELRKSFLKEKILRFRLASIKDTDCFEKLKAQALSVEEQGEECFWILPADQIHLPEYISMLLACCDLLDFSLVEPELEEVVRYIYEGQSA